MRGGVRIEEDRVDMEEEVQGEREHEPAFSSPLSKAS